MIMCLGKDKQHVSPSMTVTHASVARSTSKAQKCGIKTIHEQNFYYLQHYLTSDVIRQYNILGLLDQT
jgi:hypothetical protein